MKSDAFSNRIFPGWMRVAVTGLLISVGAAVIGGVVRNLLQGNVSTAAIIARVAAAAVYGFGVGFSFFFFFLVVAGALYWALHRR